MEVPRELCLGGACLVLVHLETAVANARRWDSIFKGTVAETSRPLGIVGRTWLVQ